MHGGACGQGRGHTDDEQCCRESKVISYSGAPNCLQRGTWPGGGGVVCNMLHMLLQYLNLEDTFLSCPTIRARHVVTIMSMLKLQCTNVSDDYCLQMS